MNPNKALEVNILDGEPHVLPVLEEGSSAEGIQNGKKFTDFVVPLSDKGIKIMRIAGSEDSGGADAQRVRAVISATQGDAAVDELMQGEAGFAQLIADAQRAQGDSKMDMEKYGRIVATIQKAVAKAEPNEKDRLERVLTVFKKIYAGEKTSHVDVTQLVVDLKRGMQNAMSRSAAPAMGGGSRKRRNVKKRRGAGSRKTRRMR
jgi:hypothetical protein